MKTKFGLFMVLSVLSVSLHSPFVAAGRIVAGVDVDAVDWAALCAGVKPIPLKTKDNACPAAHPASAIHEDMGSSYLGNREPKVDCKLVYKEYLDLKQPKPGPMPWFQCHIAFESALTNRAIANPSAFTEPLSTWRARYFTVTGP